MGKGMERLLFALNGERYEVSGLDPSMPLLEFIRTQTRFRGPKLGCDEVRALCRAVLCIFARAMCFLACMLAPA